MHEFLGLPGGFRLLVESSIIVWCNSSLWRRTWPITSHRRRFMTTFIMDLVSQTWITTSSLVILCVQLIFFIRFQHHISKTSKNLFSVLFTTHVSQPYKATLRTKIFKTSLTKNKLQYYFYSRTVSNKIQVKYNVKNLNFQNIFYFILIKIYFITVFSFFMVE